MSGARQTVTLRAATSDDAELLVAWHEDPEVSRFWDGRSYTLDELHARLRRPDVDPFVVEEDGVPVGYLQAWREEGDPVRGGLDGFLVPSARGRGIMPAAARELAMRLLAAGGVRSRSTRTRGTTLRSGRGGGPGSSRSRATTGPC